MGDDEELKFCWHISFAVKRSVGCYDLSRRHSHV